MWAKFGFLISPFTDDTFSGRQKKHMRQVTKILQSDWYIKKSLPVDWLFHKLEGFTDNKSLSKQLT